MLTAAILLAATASAFDQVVATERAFAATALDKGTHAAYLVYLADDAIEFNPTPRPARASHENKPRPKATLKWGPAWVAVSAAGDLALSSGPFEFRPDEPGILGVTRGWFMSVWRREKDGKWKLVVDSGISSPISFTMPTSVTNGSLPNSKAGSSDAATAVSAVTAAERTLAAEAKAGVGGAVAKRIEREARIYREAKPAGIGATEARALLAKDSRRVDCKPDRVAASSSGDLAYSYGTCKGEEDGQPRGYGFVHVWRKQPDGSWRVLVDVTP